MTGTVLDRINRLHEVVTRSQAYLDDAQKNLDATKVQLLDLAAVFGIVLPSQDDRMPPSVPDAMLGNGSGPYPELAPASIRV
jgi:hypothetical protein